MITVIIPALNESPTIADVVRFAKNSPGVAEVLVVDDGSIDETAQLAAAAGARVITSTLLGKGASLQDGVEAASHSCIVFLDGDLSGLDRELIPRLAAPVLADHADLVKGAFQRSAGRVTMLTAKPLLQTFFPELATFDQPLGGILAARRELLARLRFETDYGVDVGLLIDASVEGARLAEVDIGRLEHDSQTLEALGDMAKQVVRVILHRAARYDRLAPRQLREVEEVERRSQMELAVSLERLGQPDRLALFDMDGTLLDGRFVVNLARTLGRETALEALLDSPALDTETRTARIASLFRGVRREEFEEVARAMPLLPGAVETVVELRKLGYRVGIVSDSYWVAAEIVRRRVFADFSIAHLLPFRVGRATGEVTLARAMFHPRGCSTHRCCKLNVLRHVCDQLRIPERSVLAVGDHDPDICLLRAAGLSFAMQPKTERTRLAAQRVCQYSLTELLPIVRSALAAEGPARWEGPLTLEDAASHFPAPVRP